VRRALRGPKCVCPVAITLYSSSLVCLRAHSLAVTYLHPLKGQHFFFGFSGGNFSFFTVLGEVVDDIPPNGAFAFIGTSVGNGSEELVVVVVGVRGISRWEYEDVTMAVIDGGQALATLDVGVAILTSPMLASQCDDGRVGGAMRWR
jgi:hypothetical protein